MGLLGELGRLDEIKQSGEAKCKVSFWSLDAEAFVKVASEGGDPDSLGGSYPPTYTCLTVQLARQDTGDESQKFCFFVVLSTTIESLRQMQENNKPTFTTGEK